MGDERDFDPASWALEFRRCWGYPVTIPAAYAPPSRTVVGAWLAAVGPGEAAAVLDGIRRGLEGELSTASAAGSGGGVPHDVRVRVPPDGGEFTRAFAWLACPYASSWFRRGAQRWLRVPFACARALRKEPAAFDEAPPEGWSSDARRMHCLLHAGAPHQGWEARYVEMCAGFGCLGAEADAVWIAADESFVSAAELQSLARERLGAYAIKWATVRDIHDYARTARIVDGPAGEPERRACVRAACAWIGRAVVSDGGAPPEGLAFCVSFDRRRPAEWRPVDPLLPTAFDWGPRRIYLATSGPFARYGIGRPPAAPDLHGPSPIHPILFTTDEIRAAIAAAAESLSGDPWAPGGVERHRKNLWRRLFELHAPLACKRGADGPRAAAGADPEAVVTSETASDEVSAALSARPEDGVARRASAIALRGARAPPPGAAPVYPEWDLLSVDRSVHPEPYVRASEVAARVALALRCEARPPVAVPGADPRGPGMEARIARRALGPDADDDEVRTVLGEWARNGIVVLDGRRFALMVCPENPAAAERRLSESGFRRHATPWPGGIDGVWVREEGARLKRNP